MKKHPCIKTISISQKNVSALSKSLKKTLYKINKKRKDLEKININKKKINKDKNKDVNNINIFFEKYESDTHKNKINLLFTKIKIRARLLKALNNNLVLNKEKFQLLNMQYEKGNKDLSSQINSIKENKKAIFLNKKHLGLFSDFGISCKYQDIYKSPIELINKIFNENERKIIQNDPLFFKLNQEPFNKVKNNICITLADKLAQEDFFSSSRIKEKKLDMRINLFSATTKHSEKNKYNKSRNKINKIFTNNNNLFRNITSDKTYRHTFSYSLNKNKDKLIYLKSEPNLKDGIFKNNVLFDESKNIKIRPLSQKQLLRRKDGVLLNVKDKNLKEFKNEYFLEGRIKEVVNKIEKIYKAKEKFVTL